MIKQLKEIRREIAKSFGKKCPGWQPICSVCSAYQALETLEALTDMRIKLHDDHK